MNVLSGIYLLIWKNFKLKLRHPFVLLMEIGMPCLFSAILAIVRVMITFDKTPNVTSYSPMPVDNWLPIDNKVILYAPKSHLVDSLMTIFVNTSKATPKVRGFEDETKLVEHYAKENSDIISCGVVFQNMPAENFDREKLIVKIRFPFVPKQKSGLSFDKIDQFTWQTARLFPMFQQPGPRAFDQVQGGPPNYLDEGFLYVYHQIVKSILLYQNSSLQSTLNSTRINVQRFPYPPYIADKFLFALQFFFPLILMLSFIYPSVNLTKNIVLEKEQRLTQIMAMMGLRDWLHWTSWFVNSLFWSIPSLAIITVLLCVPFKPDLTIIGYSNPSLVFLFFLFYTVNSISFSFLVSTWFSRANVAGVISGAMYFITFLPYFQVNINYHDLTFVEKIVLCSIFNTNMGIGSLILSMWESEHVGLQWWNLFEAASPDDNLSFFHVLLMFLVNSVVYFLIALYIQNVFPGEFGIPKKWYFFVELDYWKTIFGQTGKTSDVEKTTDNDVKNRFESIVIENLSKSYDKGKTFSVSSLNLIMEKDEITVLLGHNGAGICPQFDVLFDHLTVSEHLWFYCKLKQIDDKQIQSEIDQIIKQLDLEPKRNQQAYTLSGGMKRKLSVGIALSGGSKFVLLDEVLADKIAIVEAAFNDPATAYVRVSLYMLIAAWEKPGLAQYLLAFVCQAVLFWGILSTIESGKFNIKTLISQWTNKTGTYDVDDLDKDEDVQQEEARIRKENTSSLAKTDSLIVKNLIKKYGNFTAVNNISFGVKRGECFGILGINGAGKTTTFRCICGSEKITSGDIYVNGPNGLIDVKKHMSQVYKSIGYCPQFCGLLDQLTGRETLRIVSRIRGIDEMLIDKQVNALAQILFFIGTPFIIFLDEPTTGVDPISRRCLWTAILSLRAAGTSLALTSHSMDEIQSLSNRLFIMIGGKIGCIASPLRLKFKYGTGYYLQLKLKKEKSTNENDFKMNNLDLKEMDEQNLTTVSNYLVARWPACTIESSHNGLLSFRLKTTDPAVSIGIISYSFNPISILQPTSERFVEANALYNIVTIKESTLVVCQNVHSHHRVKTLLILLES
ncbi:ATP-binding cassette sub- A member 3, partial [Tyrophagus putrescentiae]